MSELPSGTVTFLFTDIEGSTRLWEEHPDAMRRALAVHDALLRDAIVEHRRTRGEEHRRRVRGVRDAHDGVDAAVAMQRELAAESSGATGPLRVRMGLHTCEAEFRDGDYFGPEVNRTARLMSVAHGGQIVCSGGDGDLGA